jgi:hypothetical protein
MKKMNKPKRIGLIFILVTLAIASIRNINAQVSTENMKTFLDSKIPGIIIQVNATAETQPNQNITVMLSLKRQTSIYVECFNLSIFGFVNGTYKILMANVTDPDFPGPFGDSPRQYNCTFPVPEQVWDTTYGEITLTYNATYSGGFGNLLLPYNITLGFTMTHVENVYLKTIENQLKNLQALFIQLNETFCDSFQMNLTVDNLAYINRTFWELQQNYTALQGNLNELGNTRMAVGILAVTTVFFVATSLYLVMRKPKESW